MAELFHGVAVLPRPILTPMRKRHIIQNIAVSEFAAVANDKFELGLTRRRHLR
jgi:hypothetical protein